MKPLVSILIPAFNAQQWIADTLQSALAQSWPRKEIILVDDGSTDRTLEIARQFDHVGVTIVTQTRQGAAAARNKAYSLCHGDYIQWLDADDLLDCDKITKQMAVLENCHNQRILISCSWGRFQYRPYRAEFLPTALWCDLSPLEWLLRKMGQNIYMQTGTWLVSRELAEAAGPWDTQLLGDDDGEYFCRVLLSSDGVKFIPDAKVYYRASGVDSLSYMGMSDKKRDALWRSMQLHIKYLRSLEESDRTRAACTSYLQSSLIFFYPDRPDLIQQAQQLAQEMGTSLEVLGLSWKYSWIERCFGRRAALRAQTHSRKLKWSIVALWDKSLFRLRGGKAAPKSGTH
ncbi:MAG TPA: glycosyltransferase family 2 protein [Candidatus Acidoferrum sp.]|jgi:glycosyltransferase involved in cell wall biosynthesis